MRKDRQRARGRSRLAAAREQAVGPRHPRTAGSSPKDRELVPEYDDFQLLEIARLKTQHP
jgi:hypothetical protein